MESSSTLTLEQTYSTQDAMLD